MIIYLITNLVNQKQYVGITKTSLRKRWNKHLSDTNKGKGYYLHNAIRKHGKENFIIEEIKRTISEKELKTLETFWIKKINTLAPGGYNLTTGGEYPKFSKTTRQKLSKANSGKNNPMYERKHSEKTKEKLRKPMSEEAKHKISNSCRGRTLSKETKEKISKQLKGRKFSELHKNKISEARKGYVVPEKTKTKISETMKAQKTSSGEKNGRALVTRSDIDKIQKLRSEGIPVKKLCSLFGLKDSAIYNILNGTSWRD